MDGLPGLGRLLIAVGVVSVVLGALLVLGVRLPWLGHLPGDLRIERPNVRVYLPLTSSLLVSIVLSLLLALLRRRP